MFKRISIILLLLCTSVYAEPGRPNKPPLGSQIDWSHPLAQGLVGYWLFNEGSGDKVYDLSGNGNTGTLTNMTADDWVPGRDGPTLDFAGDNDYIEAGTGTGSLDITGDLTITAWIKLDDLITNERVIIAKQGSTTDRQYLLYFFHTNNNMFFQVTSNGAVGTLKEVSSPVSSIDTNWHFVVGRFDSASQEISVGVDGVMSSPVSTGYSTLYSSNTKVNIGARYSGSSLFVNGLIDVSLIYNRALSPQEANELFRDPYGIFVKPAEVALWKTTAPAVGAPQVIRIMF